jgi:hypothetical protein
MSKFLKSLAIALVLMAGLLSSPSSARADIMIAVTDVNTGKTLTFDDSTPNNILSNFSFIPQSNFNFTGSITLSDNTPGTQANALMRQVTVDTTSAVANDSLKIVVSDSTFISPVANSVLLATNVSPTELDGSSSLSEFSTYTTNTNISTSTSVVNIGGPIEPPTTAPGGASVVVTNTSSPFTLADSLTLNYTAANEVANVSYTTDVTPLPVPAGLALALSGMPVLSLGYWLRRRQVRPVAAA